MSWLLPQQPTTPVIPAQHQGPIIIDNTGPQLRMKALELALTHWHTSGYRDVYAMADDLCAWLHGQRQKPKGE